MLNMLRTIMKSSRSVQKQSNLFVTTSIENIMSSRNTVSNLMGIPNIGKNREFDLQLFAQDYSRYSDKDIKSAIKGLKSHIDRHNDKLINPEKYSPDWKDLNEIERNGRLRHWSAEIGAASSDIEAGQAELNRREIKERLRKGGRR